MASHLLDTLWFNDLFSHLILVTGARGSTVGPVITDNCTSYLSITSNPSRPLILKFQQFSDITEASSLPHQIFATYHHIHIFIFFLLGQYSTVQRYYLPARILTFFVTVFSFQKFNPTATRKE